MEHVREENRTRRDTSVLAAILVAVIGVTALFAAPTRAVAPENIISYQGRLLDTNGVPIAGPVDAEFRFFDDEGPGGTCLWSNSDDDCDGDTPAATVARSVVLTDGLFSENLGDTTLVAPYANIPDTVFSDNAVVYLEVEIEGETLDPRKRVVAAPYALNSQSLDGLDSTAFLSSTGDTATGEYDFTGSTLTGASPFVFEGATANAFETGFSFVDPTDDRTITFQDASGTVALLTDIAAGASLWETGGFATYEDDNDVVIGSAGDETVTAAGFSLSGNDLFVAGDIGVEGSLYSDTSVDVGGAVLDTDSLTFGAGASATIGDGVDNLTINSGGVLNIDDTNIVGTGGLIIDANGGLALNAIGDNISIASMGSQGVLIAPSPGSDTITIGSNDDDVDTIAIGSNTDIFSIASAEFDVSAATGSITIDDDVDAGLVSVEGSVLDVDGLTFVGSGTIASSAVGGLTLSSDSNNVDIDATKISGIGAALELSASAGTLSLRASDGAMISVGDGPETSFLNFGGNGTKYVSVGTAAADGYTNINSGTGDINFSSTDDYTFAINDNSRVSYVGGGSTVTGGVEYFDITTSVAGGFMEKYSAMTVADGAGAGDDFTQEYVDLYANDADADLFGTLIRANATANAGAGSYQALMTLQNMENTAGAVTDALLVDADAGGVDGITNALNVASANITNAVSAGGNYYLMSGTRFSDVGGGILVFDDLLGNALMTLTDAGATGNLTVSGEITADGDKIDSAGAPLGLNTTANEAVHIGDSDLPEVALGDGDLFVSATLEVEAGADIAGMLTVTDITCPNCLDFTEFADAMSLDASTSIAMDGAEVLTFTNGGTGDINTNLTSTGDFTVQDSGNTFFSLSDFRTMFLDSNTATEAAMSVAANSVTTGRGFLLDANALTTGNGVLVSSTSNVATSADLLTLSHTATYTANTNVSGNIAEFARNLTADGAGVVLTLSGPVARFSNTTATANGGSITDSTNVVQIVQSNTGSTVGALSVQSSATAGQAVVVSSSSTTAAAVDITANSLTTGRGLFLLTGNMTDDVGLAFYMDSAESTETADIMKLQTDFGGANNDVFRIEADGEVFSDVGFTAGAFSTRYRDGEINKNDGNLNLVMSGGSLTFGQNTTIGDGVDLVTLNSSGTLRIDDTNIESTGALIINSAVGQNLSIDTKQGGILELGNTNFAHTIEIGNGNAGNTIAIGSNNVASDAINIGTQNDVLTINTGEFDVGGGTGSITIDDGGNAGSVTVEGSILDINDLTFVGAGKIVTTGGGSDLILDSGSGIVSTAAADNFAVGAASLVASFSVDTATDTVRVGDGAGSNGAIRMFASDGDTGDFVYNTSDTWSFTGGNILHTGIGTAPTGAGGSSLGLSTKSLFTAAPAGGLGDVGFRSGDFDSEIQVTEAGGTDHNVFGVFSGASVSTANGQSSRVVGVRGAATNLSSNASAVQNFLAGIAGEAINAAAATVPSSRGLYGTATNSNAGGTTTSAFGVYGQIVAGVGTMTSGTGGYFENTSAGTTRYGVYAAASGGGTNYAGYFHSAAVNIETDATASAPGTATGAGDLFVDGQLEIDGQSIDTGTVVDLNSGTLTTGIGLSVARSTSGTDFTNTTTGLVNFTITDAGSTGTLMRLNHDGAGMSLFVDANADTGNTVNSTVGGAVHISNTGNDDYGLTVHTDNASSDNPLVEIYSENTSFDDYVLEITANTGSGVSSNGTALHILQNDIDSPAGNSVGTQALVIDTNYNVADAEPTNDLDQAMILMRENVGAAADTRFRVDADGDVWADGSYGAGASDIAEKYPSTDVLSAGELVMFDPVGTGVLRSTLTYASGLMGIVSTSPGVLLGSEVNGFMIALSGRVPTSVSDENGVIEVGDAITSSSMAGVGMKATEPGTIVGYALEAFSGPGTGTISVFVDSGFYVGNVIGTDGLSTVVTDDVVVAQLAEADAVTTGVDSSMLSLRGSGWDGVEAQEISMAMVTDVSDASDYRLSIKNTTGSEVAYVSQAGDLAIAGRLYPSDRGTLQTSKYIYYDGSSGMGGDFMRTNASGWATGSYDFAEMFPSSETLEPGDVVSFAQENESVRKSTSSYDVAVAGIVSTRPGFLAGDNREGDYPIALAGRVPTKVTLEEGSIAIGDPLTTSSTPGYAMKAAESGPIVGYAMEPFDGSGDDQTIIAFVNVSYWGGEETTVLPGTENTASVITNNTYIQQNANNLTALNMQGNIYMGGNQILSIGRMEGLSERWSVEEDGTIRTQATIKTVIESYQGDEVETTAVTSPEVFITLVGTSEIQNGEAVVTFNDVSESFNDIISISAPIRVLVTPNGPVSLYVSEKNHNGFGVRQVDGSDDNITFDWMVTAYRKGYEPVEEEEIEEVIEDVVEEVTGNGLGVTEETESETTNPTPETVEDADLALPDETPVPEPSLDGEDFTSDSSSGSTSEPSS